MPKPVVVVVDPISTGAFCLDYLLSQDEFVVTTVWSPSISPAARALEIPGLNTTSHHYVSFTTLEDTCAELKRLHGDDIAHIVSLSEPGVETADLLSHTMNLPTSNGVLYSPHRRDKFLQLERLKEAGLRTAKQHLVTSLEECVEFINDIKCTAVLKPSTSAGSDDVFKIPYEVDQTSGVVDLTLLTKRFESTFNKVNKMGIKNDVLIIQEFLSGSEYVMDTVSVNGVHKLVSCWIYAKISIKDSGDFVYLGMKLCDAEDPKVEEMFKYICGVLDALEVKNYAGHSELIYTATGPCLLEIGTRPHGGMGCFIPLQNNCYGYAIPQLFYASLLGNKNESKIQIDNYQKPRYFDEFETFPKLLRKNILGYQIDIVNYNPDGVLIGFDDDVVKTIRKLPTFLSMDLPPIGKWLPQTYDCFTIPASLTLVGDKELVEEHVELIRSLERKLFIIRPGPKPQ